MSDYHSSNPASQTQDLRDLMRRLYREIGISAVAAELQLPAYAQYDRNGREQQAHNAAMVNQTRGKAA